jgi:hypothetical protein
MYVQLSLHLIENHAVKMYREGEVERHAFLTLVLTEREWSAPRPDKFTPWKEAPPVYFGYATVIQRQSSACGEKKSLCV